MSTKTGVVRRIVNFNTIEISVVHGEDLVEVKGDKFFIAGLQDILEGDEAVVVNFDSETNVLIEDAKAEEL